MAYKQSKHLFQGMSKDLSDDKQKGIYYIDAHNIRITAREDTTLLSVTNEKCNMALNVLSVDGNLFILGLYVGHAVLNNYLVLFTVRNDVSNIWRLDLTKPEEVKSKLLYSGNLGFNADNPIETLVDYETEDVQKVYWTDRDNQPRVINIVSDNIKPNADTQFDFVPEVFPGGRNNINVQIEKLANVGGVFTSGTIQYFITYYNKFGQESNVVWQSPLLYISPSNRGGSPSEVVDNAFKIDINFSVGTAGFDYIRIYSIQHTSLDTALIGKRVIDLPMNLTVSYIDKGSYGESIDPSDLYFKGGVPIEVGTMAAKDQTLFLGNIRLSRAQDIPKELKDSIRDLGRYLTFEQLPAFTQDDAYGKTYDYYNQLNQTSWTDKRCEDLFYYTEDDQIMRQETTQVIRTFKYLETYRFGLQFQDKYGRWSEPVFIKDSQVDKSPSLAPIKIAANIGSRYHDNILVPYVHLPIAYISGLEYSSIIEELLNLGYVNVRPIIVLPEENERECIAQGVLCPTVYNVKDRDDNSPFAQPSWFFRANNSVIEGTDTNLVHKGCSSIPYRHNDIIRGRTSKSGEIEKAPNPDSSTEKNYWPTIGPGVTLTSYLRDHSTDYCIDQSIVTLNSPDIEFGPNIDNTSLDGCKFRIIGAIGLTGFSGNMDLVTSTGPNRYYEGELAEGFYFEDAYSINIKNPMDYGNQLLVNGPYWIDAPITYYGVLEALSPADYGCGFVLYPWQATGSINNTSCANSMIIDGVRQNTPITSELKYKTISNLRYAAKFQYLDSDPSSENEPYYSYDTSDIELINPDINNSISFKDSNNNSRIYYSSINSILRAESYPTAGDLPTNNDNLHYYTLVAHSFDTFVANHKKSSEEGPSSMLTYDYTTLANINFDSSATNSQNRLKVACSFNATATAIQYNSIKHAIISLSKKNDTQYILPRVSKDRDYPVGTEKLTSNNFEVQCNLDWDGTPFWDTTTQFIHQDYIPFSDLETTGTLLLGEIYREIPEDTKFGGKTEDVISQNVWIPAGKPVDLHTLSITPVRWTEGDTYFQRYDCLKTFPYSNESENNIVEILSFMCESRVNIAGRYDKNRGLEDNTFITNENFNLLNTAYSQKDNFFSYRDLDSRFDLTKFRSQLTWTKTKSAGALVDNWTNITLANTLDLDGDKGELVSLNRYKNDIIAFQPKGISQIIYNPNVQINTEAGLPIEIANSGKVQGKRYLYEGIGCQNKWSICDEVYGSLYFIDNLAKGIYKLSDQGLVSLTDTKGFRAWMEGINTLDSWKPYSIDKDGRITAGNFKTFRTFYDKTYKDVYFVNGETCLVYSDLLDQFISFMDYQGTNGMMNIGDSFYAISPLFNGSIWKQFAGEYNSIYNKYKNYSITFIDNAIPEMNKIYTNLEYRSDTYIDKQLKSDQTFDTIRVYNEYQDTGEHLINTVLDKPYLSDLQKKFRVWRIQLPRDKVNPLNRINNTWTKITLGKTKVKNEKTVLHDAIVGYYI